MPVTKDLLIRISYQGEEFAVSNRVLTTSGGYNIRVLTGYITDGSSVKERLGFTIPDSETELRLAQIAPFGWVLVNEKTGEGYTADVAYPNCKMKADLPLPRR